MIICINVVQVPWFSQILKIIFDRTSVSGRRLEMFSHGDGHQLGLHFFFTISTKDSTQDSMTKLTFFFCCVTNCSCIKDLISQVQKPRLKVNLQNVRNMLKLSSATCCLFIVFYLSFFKKERKKCMLAHNVLYFKILSTNHLF